MYYVQYKDGSCIEGEFLKVADSEGFLGQCEIQSTGQSKVVIQKNQVLSVLFPLLKNVDILPNKFISSYTVFRKFDISLGLKHLADPAYSEFITLFAQWLNVFSCNKYDVGLTKEE